MQEKTSGLQDKKYELIESPMVAEFLGFKDEDSYLESDLESAIQDVGQIDMYVRMYDELKCKEGDNPTIGILFCSETDQDIARYSVLHDNDRLFMSKYLTYMPAKEQLKHEIEKQKSIFYAQHPELYDKNDESEK